MLDFDPNTNRIIVSVLFLLIAYIIAFLFRKTLLGKHRNEDEVDNRGAAYNYFLKKNGQKSTKEKLLRIKRFRRVFWILFLGYLPAMFVLKKLLGDHFYLTRIAGFLWLGSILYVVLNWYFFVCPKCGHYFHSSRKIGNPWASKCFHCGLDFKPSEKELSEL